MSTPPAAFGPHLKSHGLSDQGRQRQDNQDRFISLERQGFGIYAVIDGVGGYAGGDRAAEIARQHLEQRLTLLNDPPERMLREAVVAANNAIYEARQQDPRFGAMACVLSAALVHPAQQRLYFAHVGDTRLYRYRQGELTKLTRDHSFVGMREDNGQLSEAEAMAHPRRNEILAQVGERPYTVETAEFMDLGEDSFIPGDVLLLCSDGLTDLVPRAGIADIIRNYPAPDRMAAWLVEAANDAGGKDNITVVVARYAQLNEPPSSSQPPWTIPDTRTAPPPHTQTQPAFPLPAPTTPTEPLPPKAPPSQQRWLWPAVAGFLALGALTALLFLWLNRSPTPQQSASPPAYPSLMNTIRQYLNNPQAEQRKRVSLEGNRTYAGGGFLSGIGIDSLLLEGQGDTLWIAPGDTGLSVGPGLRYLELRNFVVRSDSFATLLQVQDSMTQVVLKAVRLEGPISPVAGPVYTLRFGPVRQSVPALAVSPLARPTPPPTPPASRQPNTTPRTDTTPPQPEQQAPPSIPEGDQQP
jgi:serine/threonine protein phosphatase PrpC